MYGLLGSVGGGGGTKSRIEGSGVVTRKELIYLVSEISRFSKISSRSSISSANLCVSLKRKDVKHEYRVVTSLKSHHIENRL